MAKTHVSLLTIFALSTVVSQAALVWQLGAVGRGWPGDGVGGGPDVDFIQEDGAASNALPGSATSSLAARMNDDDYYFAGVYNTQVDGGPAYAPLGVVLTDELGAERAFAVADNSQRIHFNMPLTIEADSKC